MAEEKLSTNDPLDDDNQSKEGKKRVSYVSKDLKSMVDFVAKVYNQLGHTTFHSNKAIATVHGLSPDSIKMHLSSSQQYKLFELKYGIGYKVTDHFQKIYLPRTENEKRNAIIESLKNPETYQQLFKDYEYHVVPTDGVKNHFIRAFGMKDDVAARAAQIFMDNLKEFELVDARGVLLTGLPSKPTIPEVNAETIDNTSDSNNSLASNGNPELPARIQNPGNKLIFQSELEAANKKTIPIHLTDDKQALFVYPDDITIDDIELVKHQIEGILLRIKLESKKKEQPKKQEGAESPL